MPYSTQLLLVLATLGTITSKDAKAARGSDAAVRDVLEPDLEQLAQLVNEFRQQRATPAAAHRFEQQLQEQLRAVGRKVTQWTYNHVEADVAALPKHVWFEASEYTRLNAKTPQNAWTLFGQIRLWRVG